MAMTRAGLATAPWTALAITLLLPPNVALAQDIGTASVRGGFARAMDGELGSGSVAAEARLAFRKGRFELGPKVGYARLGSDVTVWDPGGVARLRLGTSTWTPTLQAGFTAQIWSRAEDLPGVGRGSFQDQDGFLGGELGVGLLRTGVGGPDYGMELSVRTIIQNTGGFEPGAFWTFTVGLETGW